MNLLFESKFIKETLHELVDAEHEEKVLEYFNGKEEIYVPLLTMPKNNLFVYESLKLGGEPLIRANRIEGSEYCALMLSQRYPDPEKVKNILRAIAYYVPDEDTEKSLVKTWRRNTKRGENILWLCNWIKKQTGGVKIEKEDQDTLNKLLVDVEKLTTMWPLEYHNRDDVLTLPGVNPFVAIKDYFELFECATIKDFLKDVAELMGNNLNSVLTLEKANNRLWASWIAWFSANYWTFVKLRLNFDSHYIVTFTQQIPEKKIRETFTLGESRSIHIEYHLSPSVLVFDNRVKDVEVLTDAGWVKAHEPKQVFDSVEYSSHWRHYYTSKEYVSSFDKSIRTFRIILKWDIERLTRFVLHFILASFLILGFLGVVFGSLTIVGSLALTSTLFFTFARLPREDPAFMARARKRLWWIFGVAIVGLIAGVVRVVCFPPDSLLEGIEPLHFWFKNILGII